MRNVSTWEISLPAKTDIGQIFAANIVPPMLAPKCVESLKTGDEHKPRLDKSEDTILDRIDLSGISEWESEDQVDIKSLLKKSLLVSSPKMILILGKYH